MNQIGEQYILGCTSLVGRYDIFKAGEPCNHFFQLEEGRSAGIALVSQHHSCPLAVAHGTRTGVGDEVDVYLFGF